MVHRNLITAFFLLIITIAFTQEKKPTVALVLSGGGAKGFAHIPTLQLLDSLNIVPDVIVGNSMGSIVGGLYAMGYSGDDIVKLAEKVDWNQVLGGTVLLEDVSVEEKSEFNSYLTEFNFEKGKIKPIGYVLNDQKLRELLNSLTYPVHNIKEFDELPIPFRALATDIVNGKEIVLKDGNLAFAMRASLSIPGVFEPVEYNNTLLVDGGILNNFPVDIAHDMGVDIIIGSDVGEGMVSMDKLKTVSGLLFQASMLNSNLKHPKNQSLCNILIDNAPNLTYSTADFVNWKTIYEEGKIAAIQNKDTLVALSNKLKSYHQIKPTVPETSNEFVLDSLKFHGISKQNYTLAENRMGIKSGNSYTLNDVTQGINRLMGTTLFNTVNYELQENSNGNSTLELYGKEQSKYIIKGSLHYDVYQGVGLIANYTGRNIFGNASRTLISLDIAEQPKFRVQFQKNFGNKRNWWWRTETFGQLLSQKIFLSGEEVDNFKNHYFIFNNEFNHNINSLTSYFGVGGSYEASVIEPRVNPDLSPSVFNLETYKYKAIELYLQYRYNKLNTLLYPTRGRVVSLKLGRALYNRLTYNEYQDARSDIPNKTNNYTRLSLDLLQHIPLHRKSTLRLGATIGFIFEDDIADNEAAFSQYGFGAKYLLGGNLASPRENTYTFSGLKNSEVFANQFMKTHISWQYNIRDSFYLTPHIDLASVGFEDFNDYISNALNPKDSWDSLTGTNLLMSAGCSFSYNSILGPVDFDVSWVNNIDKVRLFFGVGYTFP